MKSNQFLRWLNEKRKSNKKRVKAPNGIAK